MKTIQEAEIEGKNILVRIDTDVPIIQMTPLRSSSYAGQAPDRRQRTEIADDERIQASIPTIEYLLQRGAKVTIIGHIGRPDGKEVSELKMRPVEDKLIELLASHTNWQILENLRFSPGEEKNDPEFSKQLAAGQDVFVQDAFATAHRAHASTVGVAKLLPSFAGLAIQKEVEGLQRILSSPDEGFTIIIGGKKAEDKLPVIANLFSKAQTFLIGGVIANTFLAAKGFKLGKSLIEEKLLGEAKDILQKFNRDQSKKLVLPTDLVFSKSIEKPLDLKYENLEDLNNLKDYYAVDISAETSANFLVEIKNSQAIFWNGNMGVSEVEEFRTGTWKICEAIANSGAKKFAGDGDTSEFIRHMGIAENFDFISNAGGATLEYLAGKKLPGLEVLE